MTKGYKKGYARIAVLALFLSLMGCHMSGSIGTASTHSVQVR
ncbi:MAG: hypothetical protein K0R48_854 [Gammaproteobacteria bacterium]|nr:hypothetical protein [Gammaproteobacteria bacterium]